MIHQRTVVILGAGASKAYDYPTGEELRTRILDNLQSDRPTLQVLASLGHEPRHIYEFRDRLTNSDYDSIDEFLRHQPSFEWVGKCAIAQVLLKAEFESCGARKLFTAHDRWYGMFKSALLEDTGINGVSLDRISFITYNYDRSFEHYLHTTFLNGFQFPQEQIITLLNSIQIHHIHGQLGRLPWQNGDGYAREYGEDVTSQSITESAKGIKLAHENLSRREIDFRASNMIYDAERVIFLGFGYATSNLIKLGLSNEEIVANKRFVGTRKGIAHTKIEEKIAAFPVLRELRDVPDYGIREFLTERESLTRPLYKKGSREEMTVK